MSNNPAGASPTDINAITQIASVRTIKTSDAMGVASSDTAQTFGTIQSFSAGLSASSVAAGTITSTGGITFGSAVNFMAFVPQSSATNGGLWIKEGVFQIGGSALLQGSGSVNYSGNTEHLYVYGYQIIENGAAYQGARTGLTVRGGTGQSVPLFNVTRGGTSAVQVDQNGTLVAAMGLSASGATFSGNIGLQNAEYIRNTTNGRIDLMPAPSSATAYGIYFDMTSWTYGVKMGTIRSSDSSLNVGNFLWDSPLSIANDVQFNLGSNGQHFLRATTSGGLHTAHLSVNTSSGTNSGAFAIISESAAGNANRSPATSHANPNLYVYRRGVTSANDFIRVEHDGTNGKIVSGGTSGILIEPGSGVLGISGGLSAAGATFSGNVSVAGTIAGNQGINGQTGTSYTLALTDLRKLITLNNAAAVTLTLPTFASVGFTGGASVDIVQLGVGVVGVTGASGVTVRSTPGLYLRTQYSTASCIKIGTNEWLVTGDLSS